jgi:hypothetical protein
MRAVEAGHIYELDCVDKVDEADIEILRFVNREPGHEHPGTQTQEVTRALIDRTMHCDNCLRWWGNDLIIYHYRMALVLHEMRALERKTEKGIIAPELKVTSPSDGHFVLGADFTASDDWKQYMSKTKNDSPYRAKMPSFCAK